MTYLSLPLQRPMITQFHIENYKALHDVSLDLTPLHVLIGPNESGKSSILEALAALCRSVDHPLKEAFSGRWEGRSLVWQGADQPVVRMQVHAERDQQSFSYELGVRFQASGREA